MSVVFFFFFFFFFFCGMNGIYLGIYSDRSVRDLCFLEYPTIIGIIISSRNAGHARFDGCKRKDV